MKIIIEIDRVGIPCKDNLQEINTKALPTNILGDTERAFIIACLQMKKNVATCSNQVLSLMKDDNLLKEFWKNLK